MITSVRRAFCHSGLRNAVTPLEIASTPVTAAPPDANALSTSHSAGAEEQPAAERVVRECDLTARLAATRDAVRR